MEKNQKIIWLRRVLALKALSCLFIWGLPALLAPPALMAKFGITMPSDPIFVRMFGAVVMSLSLLYWFAYRDPIRNVDIVKYAIVDNGLSTLTLIGVAVTSGVTSGFFWLSGILTAFFFVAFMVLIPRGESS